MNRMIVLGVLVLVTKTALAQENVDFAYTLLPDSTFAFLPSPESPGLPGCSPNDFRCDFLVAGMVSPRIVRGVLTFPNPDLRLIGNNDIQNSPPDGAVVTSPQVEALLSDREFRQVGQEMVYRFDSTFGSFDVAPLGDVLRITGGVDGTPLDGIGFNFDVRAVKPQDGIYSIRYRLADDQNPSFTRQAGESPLIVRANLGGDFDVIVVPQLDKTTVLDRGIEFSNFQYIVGGEVRDPATLPEEWRDLENTRLSEIPQLRFDELVGTVSLDHFELSAVIPHGTFPGVQYRTSFATSTGEHGELLNIASTAIDGVDFEEYLVRDALIRRVTTGDFEGDQRLDVDDINLLIDQFDSLTINPSFDVTGDGTVDFADLEHWIEDLGPIPFGDSNLDGRFTTADLITVFQRGKFESGELAEWRDGDWNGDNFFDSGDLVTVFQQRTEGCIFDDVACQPRLASVAVPEPAAHWLVIVGLLLCIIQRGRRSYSAFLER